MPTRVKSNRMHSGTDLPIGPARVRVIHPAEIGSRIRRFRTEVMHQSMAELAKELDVSKTTVYRAENGKQVFNYKLLFRLVLRGANPDWLLYGQEPLSRDEHTVQVHMGEFYKENPGILGEVGPGFNWDRNLAIPIKANERLVRLVRDVEFLYLQSDETQQERLTGVVSSLFDMMGKTRPDDPSIIKQKSVRIYLRLGVVAQKEGNFEEALKCYESALRLDPDSEAKVKIQVIRQHMIGKEPGNFTEQRSPNDVTPDAGAESSVGSLERVEATTTVKNAEQDSSHDASRTPVEKHLRRRAKRP
jgi:DNA-binding XRE family transcriptional regulator